MFPFCHLEHEAELFWLIMKLFIVAFIKFQCYIYFDFLNLENPEVGILFSLSPFTSPSLSTYYQDTNKN